MWVACILPEIDQQNVREPKSSKTGNRPDGGCSKFLLCPNEPTARKSYPVDPVGVTGDHKRRVPVAISGDERVGFICFLDLSKLSWTAVCMGAPRWRLTLSRLQSFRFSHERCRKLRWKGGRTTPLESLSGGRYGSQISPFPPVTPGYLRSSGAGNLQLIPPY